MENHRQSCSQTKNDDLNNSGFSSLPLELKVNWQCAILVTAPIDFPCTSALVCINTWEIKQLAEASWFCVNLRLGGWILKFFSSKFKELAIEGSSVNGIIRSVPPASWWEVMWFYTKRKAEHKNLCFSSSLSFQNFWVFQIILLYNCKNGLLSTETWMDTSPLLLMGWCSLALSLFQELFLYDCLSFCFLSVADIAETMSPASLSAEGLRQFSVCLQGFSCQLSSSTEHPLLDALFSALLQIVSGIWRDKGRGTVFRGNHKT